MGDRVAERAENTASATQGTTSSRFRWFICWVVVSSYGNGLIFPYTAVYLVTKTSIGTGGTAAYFAALAMANFLTSMALGAVRVRFSPGILGAVGQAIAVVSYAALSVAHGLTLILVIAVATGVGRGLSGSALTPFTAQLVPEDQQQDAFGRRYQAMNVGLSLGLLSVTLLLMVMPPSVIAILFVANGLSYGPLAWFMFKHRGATTVSEVAEPNTTPTTTSFGQLLQYVGLICVVQFGVFALAYSQFDSTVPLAATRLDVTSLGFVSVVIGANTIGVIVLQKPITQWIKRWSPQQGVQVAVLFFLGCYLIAGATSLLGGHAPWIGLLVMAVLFACGEAAYASTAQPWLLSATPAEAHTRASSLSNAATSVGTSIGPSLGVLLVATGQAGVVWGSLAAGCAMLVLILKFTKTRSEGEHG